MVDALVAASQGMAALAARTLAGVDSDVTLPQYRTLLVVTARGPLRLIDLADSLDVTTSTATRMCDRLTPKGLIRRERLPHDRRTVRVSATPSGRRLVESVMSRRHQEIEILVRRIPASDREALVATLRAFADAVNDLPELGWSAGWKDEAE